MKFSGHDARTRQTIKDLDRDACGSNKPTLQIPSAAACFCALPCVTWTSDSFSGFSGRCNEASWYTRYSLRHTRNPTSGLLTEPQLEVHPRAASHSRNLKHLGRHFLISKTSNRLNVASIFKRTCIALKRHSNIGALIVRIVFLGPIILQL